MNREKEFNTFHPLVSFIYFVAVIGFSMFIMHPVYQGISLICSIIYCVILKGKKAFKMLLYMLPVVIITAVLNPLFNHRGVTVIAYFPSGNPLTTEAILYGAGAGVMLLCVIEWFIVFNEIMSSDKINYLFGKIAPSLALIFSMTMGFVPKLKRRISKVASAQRNIGEEDKGIVQKAKRGIKILSIVITWSLENAIDTADSMKSRGYGLSGRTSFSIFRFRKRDAVCLMITVALTGILIFLRSDMFFQYYPYISASASGDTGIISKMAYLILCGLPIIMEIKEVRRWR